MGFWSDTKTAVSATGNALSQGMELLAQGATELERVTHRMALEATIRNLEFKRSRIGDDWFESSNEPEHQELIDTYDLLLSEYPSETRASLRVQFDQLNSDTRSVAVSKQVKRVTELSNRIKSSHHTLAINAIAEHKCLIRMLEELSQLCGSDEKHRRLLMRSIERITELKDEIKGLELKRSSVEITKYSSGAKKNEIGRYDGKLTGTYQRWYENGQRCCSIPFVAGKIVGQVEQWREDGSLLIQAQFDNEMKYFHGYSTDSQCLYRVEVVRPYAIFTLCFGKLEGLSFRAMLGSKPSGFAIILTALRTPKLMAFLFKARKPGFEANKVLELSALAEITSDAVDEWLAIRKAG